MTAVNISDNSLDYMLRRAKQGATNRDYDIPADEEGLREEEIADLANELSTAQDEKYKSKILEIIRYAGSLDPMSHKHIIEPFLDDWLHASKALFILCIDWGLTSQYIEKLRELCSWCPERSLQGWRGSSSHAKWIVPLDADA